MKYLTTMGLIWFFGILIVVLIGLTLTSNVLNRLSGWKSLESNFAFKGQFSGKKWLFCSGKFGPVSYRSCLIVGTNQHGLMLNQSLPFGIFSKKLFFSWNSLKISHTKYWFFNAVRVQIREFPTQELILFGRKQMIEYFSVQHSDIYHIPN